MSGTFAPTILVTGSGGFIGSAIVSALRDKGFRVRAGVRRNPQHTDDVLCDVDDSKAARAAMAGVDLVIHAAYGDVKRMPAQSANLLAAMSSANARSLIALSSIAVYGEASGNICETTPPTGALDGYGAAKIACEAATLDWTKADGDRRAFVLRPGIVYGAGSAFWIDKLAERMRLGVWADFGPAGDGVAALIHVDDLVALVLGAAGQLLGPDRARLASCTVLNAVGPDTPTWNAYFRALAEKLGLAPLPRWSAARVAVRQKLSVGAKIWNRVGLPGARALALAPTPGEIALFSRKARYQTNAAAALGLVGTVDLAEGLARSIQG